MSHMPPVPPEPVLKPRDLGQLLDQAFKVFGRSWRSLIPIGLIAAIPSLLQSLLMAYLMPGLEDEAISNPLVRMIVALEGGDPTGLITLGAALGAAALALLLLYPLYEGALIDVAARAVLHMEPVPLSESLRVGARRYWALLGTSILRGLIWIVGVPLMIAAGLLILAFVTVPLGSLALAVVTAFASHAVVIEGRSGGFGALGRAFELGKSRFWPLMGIGIVFTLLTTVLQSMIVTPVSFATGMAMAATESPGLLALTPLVQGLTSAVIIPFSQVGLTLVYFDTRIRREGFDLEVMARQQQAEAQTDEPRP